MPSVTTIKIERDLRDRLNTLKTHPRQSYNEVIRHLVDMATDDEPLSNETLERIEVALKDLREGLYVTEEEIDAELELR